MSRSMRAGFAGILTAAALAFLTLSVHAADKAYSNPDLDQAAISLEAQIKQDAGTVAKTPQVLRREADAAFQKKDVRNGMVLLGQLVAAAPGLKWIQALTTGTDAIAALTTLGREVAVTPGKVIYEIMGVPEELAREAFRLAAAKLPLRTTFVTRHIGA